MPLQVIFKRLLEPSRRSRRRANRLKKRRRPESTSMIGRETLPNSPQEDQFIHTHNSLPLESSDFMRHVDKYHSSSPPESAGASLDRLLREAELETIRVKLEKQDVVDELMKIRQTVHIERSRRIAIEDHLQAISRVVVGLSFDAGMTEPALSLLSAPGSTSNIPEKLRRIREHVRTLEKTRESQFEDIGDLEREIDDLRNAFAERELAWWDQTQKIKACHKLIFQIQIEYGMALWRQRGLELEMLSIHHELDGLQDQFEFEREDQTALSETQTLVHKAHEFIETQHRLIDDTDRKMGQLLYQARILADSVRQQKASSIRQLQAMARGFGVRRSGPEGPELVRRKVQGRATESERSSTTQSTDEETLLNISPKKVHFELPPLGSTPPLGFTAHSSNGVGSTSSRGTNSTEGSFSSADVWRDGQSSGLSALNSQHRGPFQAK